MTLWPFSRGKHLILIPPTHGGGGGGGGVATQKNLLKKTYPKIGKVGKGLVFVVVFLRFFCWFFCSNNFKRFKKYPNTFRLLYDQGETSNQHLIITKEYNIYVRRVS